MLSWCSLHLTLNLRRIHETLRAKGTLSFISISFVLEELLYEGHILRHMRLRLLLRMLFLVHLSWSFLFKTSKLSSCHLILIDTQRATVSFMKLPSSWLYVLEVWFVFDLVSEFLLIRFKFLLVLILPSEAIIDNESWFIHVQVLRWPLILVVSRKIRRLLILLLEILSLRNWLTRD